jgi:hypothetical protein
MVTIKVNALISPSNNEFKPEITRPIHVLLIDFINDFVPDKLECFENRTKDVIHKYFQNIKFN